ncbi:peroxiredoxin family protein [Acidobacteriota bacterium]
MMKTAGVLFFVILWSAVFPLASSGQIAQLIPENPKWGDNIRVTYDPAAEGAAFFVGDEVFTAYYIYRHGETKQEWSRMEFSNGLFSCDISIEKGTAFLTFYFITMEKMDRKAGASTMVLKEDGTPPPGANHQMMLNSSKEEYLDYFRKEREMYPDNFAVVRDKWFIMGAYDKENLKSNVEKEIGPLEDRASSGSDELLFALSYGYLLLDKEADSRKIIRNMVEKYPRSFYTGYALSNYDYQVFAMQLKGEGPREVLDLKKSLLKKSPKSQFTRKFCPSFIDDDEVSLKTIEKVCDSWIKEEDQNPMPFYILADSLLKKGGSLKRAASFIDKATNFFIRGKLRFYQDIGGFMTQSYLPRCYLLSSKIRFNMGDLGRALSDIKAALALQSEARSEYFDHEAEVWRKLGYMDRAEQAFFESYKLGSPDAEKALKEIFKKRHGSLNGFEDYFASSADLQSTSQRSVKDMAPAFTTKTLQGEDLDLSSLKGKVIVLNFWFIGCAPCRVEMPGLNKLTDEFKGEDVVFIAFALDPAEALTEFLKTTTFKYQVVPKAQEIASLYGAEVYPTHIIINKRGEIEYRLTGGSPERHEQIRPLIENLLR